jgi:hypothetical protein
MRQVIILYVTLFVQSFGTLCQGMTMVFVPLFLPSIPWARRPSLLPYKCVQVALIAVLAIRCRYLSNSPSLPSTKLAILQSQLIGNMCVASLAVLGVNVGFVTSMQASIASCMMLVVHDWVLNPCHHSSSSSYKVYFGLVMWGPCHLC